ncbi:hypothetical protein LTR53_005246 [Teratosphaeriaceae sp. CCFEE 6253]|nr:hypothetical protein LTR53_005246 [Teratosphaeriaceae sp. CCFEE 6253]
MALAQNPLTHRLLSLQREIEAEWDAYLLLARDYLSVATCIQYTDHFPLHFFRAGALPYAFTPGPGPDRRGRYQPPGLVAAEFEDALGAVHAAMRTLVAGHDATRHAADAALMLIHLHVAIDRLREAVASLVETSRRMIAEGLHEVDYGDRCEMWCARTMMVEAVQEWQEATRTRAVWTRRAGSRRDALL